MTGEGLLRRGKLLEYLTLGWNLIGMMVLLRAASAAHSVALTGFSFDTLLEIGASVIVIWELNGAGRNRQRKGLRLLAFAFLLLGAYLLARSSLDLAHHAKADRSFLGLAWLAMTFAAMLILAYEKNRTGRLLANPVLLTESRVTLVDAVLAGVVLTGMLLEQYRGWWWADIAGAFLLMGYCFREAVYAWKASRN